MHRQIVKCLCFLSLCSSTFAAFPQHMNFQDNKTSFHIDLLYLQPKSNNLKYAVLVSGSQPLSQSWHYQTIDPKYSPAFEIGLNYALPCSLYNASIDWLHLDTSDSASKQASTNTQLNDVEFVAPSYDVGPAVFGIKHAESTAKFNFDSIALNIGRLFEYCPNVQVRLFGGINALRLKQTITTTFNDFTGTPPTSISYGLPADPSFYFETENTSDYFGVGPDIGLTIQYQECHGFGVLGQFMGTITAGTMKVKDDFTSASQRLSLLGITTSHQDITAPNMTQIVPGFDAKLGLFYNHEWCHLYDFQIEGGYRIAYYVDAISDVNPATLVQAGLSEITPEFATGTMAINSTDSRDRPFGYNGPYLRLTFALT